MSRVRTSILAALAAIGFGLCGASTASAVPANGAAINQAAPKAEVQKVWYRRYRSYRPYCPPSRSYYGHYRRPYYGYRRPYYSYYRRPYYSYYRRPYYRPYYGYYRSYYRPYYRYW